MQFIHNLFFNRQTFTIVAACCFVLIASNVYSSSTSDSKRTIVIDPGHGGFDTGAKGADSTLEKNISLLFAKKIKSKLEKKYIVVLTRTGDYWIDTRQRTEIANSTKAELFISIHANASFVRETKGLSLIYYKPYVTKAKPSTIKNQAQWHQAQEKFIPLSRLFTKALFKKLSKNPNHNNSKISSLPHASLSGVNMPAMVIEIGYLTNPFEEKQLNNSDFLSDYAKEISTEICSFLEKHPIIY